MAPNGKTLFDAVMAGPALARVHVLEHIDNKAIRAIVLYSLTRESVKGSFSSCVCSLTQHRRMQASRFCEAVQEEAVQVLRE